MPRDTRTPGTLDDNSYQLHFSFNCSPWHPRLSRLHNSLALITRLLATALATALAPSDPLTHELVATRHPFHPGFGHLNSDCPKVVIGLTTLAYRYEGLRREDFDEVLGRGLGNGVARTGNEASFRAWNENP